MNHYQFPVSVGSVGVTWNSRGQIIFVDWYDNTIPAGLTRRDQDQVVPLNPQVARLIRRIETFFECGEPIGKLDWDLIDDSGWSDFQKRVYRTIVDIPHGETRTYAWAANRIGRLEKVAAPRAVGQALKRNPLPLLIPCHRIVAASGPGGFMGCTDPNQSELRFKHWLLEHESRYLSPVFSFLSPVRESIG